MDDIVNKNHVFGRNVRLVQGLLLDVLSSSQVLIKLTSENSDDQELLNEKVLEYDYLAICTGSQYCLNEKDPTELQNIVTRQQRLNLLRMYSNSIDRAKSILVVGGGPTGVEFLAEIIDKYGKTKDYGIMERRDTLLSQYPEAAREAATRFFEKNLVSIHANSKFELKRGIASAYDFVLMCVGTKWNSDFFSNKIFKDWKDDTGRIFVNKYFQVTNVNPCDDVVNEGSLTKVFKNIFWYGGKVNLQSRSLIEIIIDAWLTRMDEVK